MTNHDELADAPAPGDDRPPVRREAAGPDREASVPGLSPPPLPSWEILRAILDAERQWWEVERDLKEQHGMTLNDLAVRLEQELEATA